MKNRSILKSAAVAAGVAFLPVASFIAGVWLVPEISLAQSGPEPQSAVFLVSDRDMKTVGRYEFNQVVREEGVFATSRYFKGAASAKSKKKEAPAVRSYLEMAPDRTFAKYTRWESQGINVREFKIFRYQKDVRMRDALGSKAGVSVLGKWQPVFLVEEDQPHTAAMIVDRNVPEKTFACINTTLGKIGQATVRIVGVTSVKSVVPDPAPVQAAGSGEPATQVASPEPVVTSPEPAAAAAKPVKTAAETTGRAAATEPTVESAEPASEPATAAAEPASEPATAAAEPAAEPATAAAEPANQVAAPGTADIYEFRVEGDCGVIGVWQDGSGNFVRFSNSLHTFEPVAR